MNDNQKYKDYIKELEEEHTTQLDSVLIFI